VSSTEKFSKTRRAVTQTSFRSTPNQYDIPATPGAVRRA
jgi:hypothetical protein